MNDEIDEMLKAERAALRRRKKPVKVLALPRRPEPSLNDMGDIDAGRSASQCPRTDSLGKCQFHFIL